MKKLTALLIVLALLLTGCGSSKGGAPAASDAAPEAVTTEAKPGKAPGLYADLDVYESESILYFLALREDGTGLLGIEDWSQMTWDETHLYPLIGTDDAAYRYQFSGRSITVPEFGWQFTRCDELLPDFPEIRDYLENGALPDWMLEPQGGSEDSHFAEQQQILRDNGCICGVIYLGSVADEDITADPEALQKRTAPYQADFLFLADPAGMETAQASGGTELYCIYPADPYCSLAVDLFTSDPDNGDICTILYRSEYGYPVLLRAGLPADAEDGFLQVSIVDNSGHSLVWEPALTADGRLDIPASGSPVWDATQY